VWKDWTRTSVSREYNLRPSEHRTQVLTTGPQRFVLLVQSNENTIWLYFENAGFEFRTADWLMCSRFSPFPRGLNSGSVPSALIRSVHLLLCNLSPKLNFWDIFFSFKTDVSFEVLTARWEWRLLSSDLWHHRRYSEDVGNRFPRNICNDLPDIEDDSNLESKCVCKD
jgi:hypothetical protein